MLRLGTADPAIMVTVRLDDPHFANYCTSPAGEVAAKGAFAAAAAGAVAAMAARTANMAG